MRQALVKNDYGAVVRDGRAEEIREFMQSVGIPINEFTFERISASILSRMERDDEAMRRNEFDPLSLPEVGYDFEHWVAHALLKYGWKTRVTARSGDQGIDVLAEKNGTEIAVQCKLYNGPVGNKAVQEAIAGAIYYRASVAVVISNADFTKSARDLAGASGALLIGPSDIPSLETLVKGDKRS